MIRRAQAGPRSGFTLAEVAVTIVIVGIGLVLVLQGLNTAQVTAGQTRNQKLARELGLLTLGEIEAGLVQDDLQTGLMGTYAEEGYPDFSWEIAVGDDTFRDAPQDGAFDSWAPTQSELDAEAEKDDEEEDVEEPFEKIKVKVVYPKIRDFKNELVLERWVAWKQAYGVADAEGGSTNPKAVKSDAPVPAGGSAK